jgi:hypothetical protein
VKPQWYERADILQRKAIFKKRVARLKNPEVLPEYPVKITPHMNDGKPRQPKPKLWRKISYEIRQKF